MNYLKRSGDSDLFTCEAFMPSVLWSVGVIMDFNRIWAKILHWSSIHY
jgi:hypothetical protein